MILGGFKVLFTYTVDYRGTESTTCTIADKINGEILCYDTITKYFKDESWEKDRLRKEVLKRALKDGTFTKEERTAIWEDYRISKPIPRWGTGRK